MRINKALKALFGAVIVSAALSSCSAASVEELLSPPRLNEEQTAIYEALRTAAGGSVSLKYPKSGQYRSAFVVENIDGEPTNEAIVFYEKPNVAEGSYLRINFLDMQEEKWVSVYDFAASGSEVERVMFKDLGDGETIIIITYYIQNSSDMASSVIKFSDGSPREVFSGRHSYMDVFDADGNGKEEMFNDIPLGVEIAARGNVTFSGSREAMLQAVDAMLQTSKKAIEQVPYHKSVIAESEKMLEVLNPQYAENKQNARVIQSLQEKQKAQEQQLAELKAQNTEMLNILRQLNGSSS